MEHTGIGSVVKNTGIKFSRGALIAFNDSDDLWAPEKLEKQINALQQYPEAGFCLTNGYNFKNTKEPLEFFYKKREGLRYGDLFPFCFQSEVAGFTQALMVKKKHLFEIGLFKETKAFPDVDLIISLSKECEGIILYEPLVSRRLHDTNHSSGRWEKAYYEGRDVIKQYKTDLPKQIYKDALFRLYMNFGNSCLTRNEKRKSIRQFFKAWQYRPLSLSPFKGIVKTLIHRRSE
jgi:glycosyltransferase involved in cell wall biosynthesis